MLLRRLMVWIELEFKCVLIFHSSCSVTQTLGLGNSVSFLTFQISNPCYSRV